MASRPACVADVVEWLRKRFCPDTASGLSIAYQFELAGAAGGSLWARIDQGRLEAEEGRLHEPDVLLRLEAADFFAVLVGAANPDLLFMEQKIHIEGDLSLALKLRTLFGTPA